jgi:hypothetical protein
MANGKDATEAALEDGKSPDAECPRLEEGKPEEEQKDAKSAKSGQARVLTEAEWAEVAMMRSALGTRQGKALLLDFLDGEPGRYVEMTEEGRRTFGEERDAWQDY